MTFASLNPQELNDVDYIRFRDLILERSGLYFSKQKRFDLSMGLNKALTESRLITSNRSFDLNTYYNLLSDKNNPMGRAEMGRLINILTVGETYFFRDEAQFDALNYHVLPDLIAKKRTEANTIVGRKTPKLRIWSAGCSSGEEPYSIAILLKELLPDIAEWDILILGTDINEDVLKRAKAATYTNWSFREARAKAFRQRYFTQEPHERHYNLREDIQKMVTFRQLNLMERSYPSHYTDTVGMDLIICRNVTIYFKHETTQAIINRFYDALSLNGWLIVGHAESSLTTYQAFQPRSFPGAILYQKTGTPQATFSPVVEPSPKSIVSSKPFSTPPKSSLSDSSVGKPASIYSTKSTVFTPSSPTPLTSPASPTPGAHISTAQHLLEQGKVSQAVITLEQLRELEPNSAQVCSLLGRAYADMGQWPQAKTMCEEAIKLDTFNIPAYLTLASIYQEEGKFELAVTNLKKATFLDHTAAVPYFNLAMLYQKIGQFDQAKRHLQISVRVLEKHDPHEVLPDTGGKTVRSLLTVCRHLLMTWQTS